MHLTDNQFYDIRRVINLDPTMIKSAVWDPIYQTLPKCKSHFIIHARL